MRSTWYVINISCLRTEHLPPGLPSPMFFPIPVDGNSAFLLAQCKSPKSSWTVYCVLLLGNPVCSPFRSPKNLTTPHHLCGFCPGPLSSSCKLLKNPVNMFACATAACNPCWTQKPSFANLSLIFLYSKPSTVLSLLQQANQSPLLAWQDLLSSVTSSIILSASSLSLLSTYLSSKSE